MLLGINYKNLKWSRIPLVRKWKRLERARSLKCCAMHSDASLVPLRWAKDRSGRNRMTLRSRPDGEKTAILSLMKSQRLTIGELQQAKLMNSSLWRHTTLREVKAISPLARTILKKRRRPSNRSASSDRQVSAFMTAVSRNISTRNVSSLVTRHQTIMMDRLSLTVNVRKDYQRNQNSL